MGQLSHVRTVLCDLDGVVWLAREPIPGAVDAIARVRHSGRRVLFVTNNSSAPIAVQEAALAAIGIPAAGDVVTSAQAAASLVDAGERVVACAGPGVIEALEAVGAECVAAGPADAVVVGFHLDFDYERLRLAASAIHGGARLIGTNDDATYPTPGGPIPGGGALLAAVAVAGGVVPVVAGKPYPPMAELVRTVTKTPPGELLMVGDRPETDGLFAATIGCEFALVRTGVTAPGASVSIDRIVDLEDLAAVADLLL